MKEAYLTSGSSPGTLDERIAAALPADLPATTNKPIRIIVPPLVIALLEAKGRPS